MISAGPDLTPKVTRCCNGQRSVTVKVDETPEMDEMTALWTQRLVEGEREEIRLGGSILVPINDTVM